MSPDRVAAEELASRLVSRFAARREARETGGEAVAARLACEQVYRDLARWLGPESARSLLARGVAAARLNHAAMEGFRPGENTDRVFEDAPAIIAAHGSAAVGAALDAVLVAMLELLGRLVGNDLAARLVDSGDAGESVQDERPT